MAVIRIKPGETLAWTATDDSGDLTGFTIESAVSTPKGDFYYPLTITPTDLPNGQYEIDAVDTSSFPVGPLDCDIKYSVGGVVTYTETFRFYVDKRVTK